MSLSDEFESQLKEEMKSFESRSVDPTASLLHLSALAGWIIPPIGPVGLPLALWIWKRNSSTLIDREGRKAVNFQVLLLLIFIVVAVISSIPLIGWLIGGLLFLLLMVANLLFVCIAAFAVSKGQPSSYPLAIDFIGMVEEKFLNKNFRNPEDYD